MPLTNTMLPSAAIIGAMAGIAPYPGGALIFVNSATGKDSRGRLTFQGTAGTVTQSRSAQGPWNDPSFPLASVFGPAGALSYCQANRGDLIIVAPGHTENLATGALIPIPAGVTIIGGGYGNLRPQYIVTVAGTAIQYNAACMIQNCIIDMTGVAGATTMTVSASGIQLANCRIIQVGAANGAATAFTLAAGCADLILTNTEIDGTGAAANGTQAIITSGASLIPRIELVNCFIHGNFSAACIKTAAAGNALSELIYLNSTFRQTGTVVPVFVWSTADTGSMENCTFGTLATAGPPTPATISGSPPVGIGATQCFATSGNTAAARGGLLTPAATTL